MATSPFKMKTNCTSCPLEVQVRSCKLVRESKINEYQLTSDLESFDNVDILFLTDTVEDEDELKKLNKFVQNLGVKNYVITNAVGCKTRNYEFPTPLYSTYVYCKRFDIEKYNPKVVITLGKAIFHFTKGSVFASWREFREFLFNDTYFYPHIKSKWKGRIYPVGFLPDIFDFSSFENHHFKFQVEQCIKHVANYALEKFIMPEYKVEIVDDADKFMSDHDHEPISANDTETNSLNVFVDDFKMGCAQLSFDGKTSYVLPAKIITNKRKFSGFLSRKEQWYAAGKYDSKVFNRVGISGFHVDEDVTLLYHVLNIERESNSIKVLSWFLGLGGYEDELDNYKAKYKIKNYLDIPEYILFPYAGIDTIVVYLLMLKAKRDLIPRQEEVYKLYKDAIIPVIPVFQSIEEEGLLVDKEYVQKYHEELVSRLKIVENEMFEMLGKKINIASNDELGKAFEEMGLPDHGRTLKGIYRTGEEILVQWDREGYPIVKKLLEYRKLAKLDNTYVGNIEESEADVSPFGVKGSEKEEKEGGIVQYVMSDGRVHGNILPAITDSWRSGSNKPNLQNFVHSLEFRKVFIPPEDYYICEADYSGFQFRLECDYSRDPEMMDAFINKGGDLHSSTGFSMFCKDPNITLDYFMKHKNEEPYYTIRKKGKITNLALAFMYSAYSFQTNIKDEWTDDEIKTYIKDHKLTIITENKTGFANEPLTVATHLYEGFFKKYSRLQEYQTERQELAMKQGYVDCTRFSGARRHLPELLYQAKKLSKDKLSHYSNLKNIAVNAEAQAGEALNVYYALRRIYDAIRQNNYKSRLIGMVHDSIVIYLKKSEVKDMCKIIRNSMERFDYSIPILCEVSVGRIWGFSPEIKNNMIDNSFNDEIVSYIESKL
jgi:DNA polymerase I-like protein with 3'-5' exonuclease and polymerase domains